MTRLNGHERSIVTIGTLVVSAGLIALVAELPPIPASLKLSPVSAGVAAQTSAATPSASSESRAGALHHAQVSESPRRTVTHRVVVPRSTPSVSSAPDLHPSTPQGSGSPVRSPATSSSPTRSPSPHASPSVSATPTPHPDASPSPSPDPTSSPSPSTSEPSDG